jgi:predicted nucleotidyltransferase
MVNRYSGAAEKPAEQPIVGSADFRHNDIMTGHAWGDAPDAVRQQVTECVRVLQQLVSSDLVGVYLFGSLATGGFNPRSSDIDLLVATKRSMAAETKRRIAESLLRLSNAPAPLEVTFLTKESLRHWRHPSPYDFHFSEDWRETHEQTLRRGDWPRWQGTQGEDSHVAVSVTMARKRGISLFGSPADSTLPQVPGRDFVAAILAHRQWVRERMNQFPAYAVLNHCRTLAYLREKQVLSKTAGGVWALTTLPEQYHDLIAQALEQYGGDQTRAFDTKRLAQFLDHVM